jgi:hypothetical protein
MRWVGLGADVLLACVGVILLLYAYRVLGKPPGADEKYDAAMARQSPTYKVSAWVIVVLALLALLDHLVGGLL